MACIPPEQFKLSRRAASIDGADYHAWHQDDYLAEIIRDAAEFALRGANLRCEYAMATDLWLAEVDAGQIAQVIHNLVINAKQAMPEGGIITIRAANLTLGEHDQLALPAGRYLHLAVQDHGMGIAEENRERIFEPFFSTSPKIS